MSAVAKAAFAVVAGIVVVALYVILQGSNDYLVRAEFHNADGVRSGFYVEIGGLQAGTIQNVSVNRQGLAVVTMKLSHGAYPIGSGATAMIKPVNLLGEKYVDLNPGNLNMPQPSGSVIPASRTDNSVDLDQILDMLDPTTAARLRIMVNEAGVAVAGRGSNLNALLVALPGSLQQLGTMISGFSQDNEQLRALIQAGQRVISSADSRRADLQQLITNAEQTLQTVASRRRALASTVATAAPGLRELRTTLAQLQQVAADLRPTAIDIRQTAPFLTTTLKLLPSFAAAAGPALGELRQVAPSINRLSLQATPTVEKLVPTFANLRTFATLLAPTMSTLADKGAFQNLLRFVNNWGTLTGKSDGLGHVFRVRITLDPATLGLPRATLAGATTQKQAAGRGPAAGAAHAVAFAGAAAGSSKAPGASSAAVPPAGSGSSSAAPPGAGTSGSSSNPLSSLLSLAQYLLRP